MTTLAPFVVHTAAAAIGWVQPCAACGWPLIDNTAWAEGRVAVPIEDDGRGPSWWPVGAQVATDKASSRDGGMTYVVAPDGRPLDDDERLCGGTN